MVRYHIPNDILFPQNSTAAVMSLLERLSKTPINGSPIEVCVDGHCTNVNLCCRYNSRVNYTALGSWGRYHSQTIVNNFERPTRRFNGYGKGRGAISRTRVPLKISIYHSKGRRRKIGRQTIVRRRYSRLKKEDSELPDLIIIDGGRGQLNFALEELVKLDLKIPIISIAKKFEEIYLPGRFLPLKISKKDKALHFIQEIRDEAHRFAIKYNRLLRKKELIS